MTGKRFCLSGLALKALAMITMLIDHTGVAVQGYYGVNFYWVLRLIGRTAFPLFAFLLTEGFAHTRSRWKYLRNLLCFAVISEIPFDLLSEGQGMNIYWTLSLGLLSLMGAEGILRSRDRSPEKWGWCPVPLLWAVSVIPAVVLAGAAAWLDTDYGAWGVAIVAALGYARLLPGTVRTFRSAAIPDGALPDDAMTPDGVMPDSAWEERVRTGQNRAAAWAIVIWMAVYDLTHGMVIELFGCLGAVPALLHYNGTRGAYPLPKWVFYAFYPVHLLILAGFRHLLWR